MRMLVNSKTALCMIKMLDDVTWTSFIVRTSVHCDSSQQLGTGQIGHIGFGQMEQEYGARVYRNGIKGTPLNFVSSDC